MSSLPRAGHPTGQSIYRPQQSQRGSGPLEVPTQRKGQANTDRGAHSQPERGAVRSQTDRETQTDRQTSKSHSNTNNWVCVCVPAPGPSGALSRAGPIHTCPTRRGRKSGLPGGPGPGRIPREPEWLAAGQGGARVEELSLAKGLKQKEVRGVGLSLKEDGEAGQWESLHPSPRPCRCWSRSGMSPAP